MIGTSTTVIAPVGPDTCRLDPPKTAANAPATTAVVRPAAAPSPEEIPKPSASGSATIATVRPASQVAPRLMEHRGEVVAGRKQRTRPIPDAGYRAHRLVASTSRSSASSSFWPASNSVRIRRAVRISSAMSPPAIS